jgi:hypothetical protein
MTICQVGEGEKDYLCYKDSVTDFADCNCPHECESIEFTYTISAAEYPTLWYYENYLKNKLNLSYSETKESVAKVEISFAQMRTFVISEEKKVEFFDMISSVGGTLGLFLGLSFLSLVEFVEILVQAILIRFEKDKNRVGTK